MMGLGKSGRCLVGWRSCVIGVLLVVSLSLAPVSRAAAQDPAAPSASDTSARPVTVEELKDLVSTLEDDSARAAFIRQLRALIAARSQLAEERAEPPGGALLAFASTIAERIGNRAAAAASILLDLPQALGGAWSKLARMRTSAEGAGDVGRVMVIFLLGLALQGLMHRVVRRPQARLTAWPPNGWVQRLGLLLAYTLLDLAPIGVFAGAAFLALSIVDVPRGVRLATFALIEAHVLSGLVAAAARFALAPRAASLRLIGWGDEAANYAYLWIRRLSAVGIYGYILASSSTYFGVPRGVDRVAIDLVGLVVVIMMAMVVLQNRAAIAAWLRGAARAEPAPPGSWARIRAWVASGWHILALIYLFAAYVVWAADVPGGFRFLVRGTVLTALVLLFARLISAGIHRAINRGFALSEETKARLPLLEARANRYSSVFHTAVRIVVYGIAALAILQAWSVDSLDVLASDLGKRALSSLFTIGAIFIVAFLVWEGVNAALDYHVAKAGGSARQAKLRTALPILRRILLIALAVMVVLSVLSQIGINVAPLLAGAGVIGIAVGLGAQSLAKDVLKGLSILLEDSIAVGDVVSVGGRTGLVEDLSVGSIRLRDLNGAVHIIPFSEVTTIVNMSKEYAYAVIEASVGYGEDIDRVSTVLEEVGAALRADPAVGPDILEPIEVIGVERLGESSVVIRARMKTRPIKNWDVERAFRRRMKMRFDELGIEIPFPQRTVHIAGPPTLPRAAEDGKLS